MLKLTQNVPTSELIETFITSSENSKRLSSLNSLMMQLHRNQITLFNLTEQMGDYITSKDGVSYLVLYNIDFKSQGNPFVLRIAGKSQKFGTFGKRIDSSIEIFCCKNKGYPMYT